MSPNPRCKKTRFRTEVDAKIVIGLGFTRRHTRKEKVPVRAYYHRECKAWHTTSQP